MHTIPVDLDLLKELFDHCSGRVRYELGEKAPSLDCDSSRIRSIDCSGWARYAIYRATNGAVRMPDGSQAQKGWCARQGFKVSTYDADGAGRHDGALRIAFASPDPGDEWPRHVWLIKDGMTMESYGGHGVGSRRWNDHVLAPIVTVCYVLTPPL